MVQPISVGENNGEGEPTGAFQVGQQEEELVSPITVVRSEEEDEEEKEGEEKRVEDKGNSSGLLLLPSRGSELRGITECCGRQ